ncbi:MAG: hypothetical protein JXR96_20715 [Deltaproteobacteria bacterium]|nr:hypothetical protein [Deltaproteobacteria bacterium]
MRRADPRPLLACALLAWTSGCVSYRVVRASSLDRMPREEASLELAAPAGLVKILLTEIMAGRGFPLVHIIPAGDGMALTYKGARREVTTVRGSAQQIVHQSNEVGSWFAARLWHRDGGGLRLLLFGKPTLNGVPICSDADRELADLDYWCKDSRIIEDWPAFHLVQGTEEAETVRGALSQLTDALAGRGGLGLGGGEAGDGAARLVVAVFDLEDRTEVLEPEARRDLAEYLRNRLAASGRFEVVARARMRERLLAEKGESHRDCFDSACQIELGKALAAQATISASLLRVEDGCTLTATLYDLKRETAGAGASERSACSMKALMASIDALAERLAAGP